MGIYTEVTKAIMIVANDDKVSLEGENYVSIEYYDGSYQFLVWHTIQFASKGNSKVSELEIIDEYIKLKNK